MWCLKSLIFATQSTPAQHKPFNESTGKSSRVPATENTSWLSSLEKSENMPIWLMRPFPPKIYFVVCSRGQEFADGLRWDQTLSTEPFISSAGREIIRNISVAISSSLYRLKQTSLSENHPILLIFDVFSFHQQNCATSSTHLQGVNASKTSLIRNDLGICTLKEIVRKWESSQHDPHQFWRSSHHLKGQSKVSFGSFIRRFLPQVGLMRMSDRWTQKL